MRASGSHVVSFNNSVFIDFMLGVPDDYIREPLFSAGVIRCAAVHVGGAHAVFDAALKTAHAKDTPCQRPSSAASSRSNGNRGCWGLCLAGLCRRELGSHNKLPAATLIACMNAARGAIERAALNVMELAERSVGVADMMAPHPLERLMRDLRTYLRQPNSDGALASVGAAVTNGVWLPDEEASTKVHHD